MLFCVLFQSMLHAWNFFGSSVWLPDVTLMDMCFYNILIMCAFLSYQRDLRAQHIYVVIFLFAGLRNLVDKHSLCTVNATTFWALDKLTPSISNKIWPLTTRAIHLVEFLFLILILTLMGLLVIGISAKTLTHIWSFLRDSLLIIRCSASMAWYEIRFEG
jgi:hypothetical protein